MNLHQSLPILYSFRRCPYAIRARMVLNYSQINYELREVDLKNKPKELLELSPKATVPVMVIKDSQVIDESLDIIQYALSISDSENISSKNNLSKIESLIALNDTKFVKLLRQYKYPEMHPNTNQILIRKDAEMQFLSKYEEMLSKSNYLLGDKTIADYAILPFIRQFAYVNKEWFFNSEYTNLIKWLISFIDTEEFNDVIMKKTPIWVNNK